MQSSKRSLIVEFFTIVSGWVSAILLSIFLAGFLVLFLRIDPDNSIPFIIMGVVIMIFAIRSLLQEKNSEYQEHFLIALSMAGQALLFFGMTAFLHRKDMIFAFIAALVLNTALSFYVKNRVHRYFTSMFATISLLYAIIPYGSLVLIATPLLSFLVVWISLFAKSEYMIVVYGITSALLINIFSIYFTFGYIISIHGMISFYDASMDHFFIKPWMSNLAIGGVFLYLIYNILNYYKLKSKKAKAFIFLFALFFIVLGIFYIKSILIPIIIITVGFFIKEKALFIIGILSLLTFLATYYYRLDMTLAQKSYILFLSGIVLIGFYFWVKSIKRGLKDA